MSKVRYPDRGRDAGAPAEWLENGRAIGPLASFDGADSWVDFPHREGIVLIGDAAAASDPSFGSGLSLTLRDVRVLRDHILREQDWHTAAQRYAQEHDRYYASLHRIHTWFRDLWFGVGAEADEMRARALPRIAEIRAGFRISSPRAPMPHMMKLRGGACLAVIAAFSVVSLLGRRILGAISSGTLLWVLEQQIAREQ